MKLSEQIEGIFAAQKKLCEFADRLGDSEQAGIFDLSADREGGARARVYFFTGINREKALSYIGKQLGCEGWTKHLEGSSYNWKKQILEVEVTLYQVQEIGMPPVLPVDPKEFPIQLEDVKPC